MNLLQAMKDSFYLTMRDRLAVVNPARTINGGDGARPAIYVAENELASAIDLPECFVIEWGNTRWTPQSGAASGILSGAGSATANSAESSSAKGHASGAFVANPTLVLLEAECDLRYWSAGSESAALQDRGRTLAQMDWELLRMALPARVAVYDHAQSPAVAAGITVSWTLPLFQPVKVANPTTSTKAMGARLIRSAQFMVRAYSQAGTWS